ncbi:hypothetical protein AAA799B03_01093 [Marine Group I thaumarchaeote SCGC AAA799-B03]|uniref:Uncharacterized protein n=1 Tax=Marine Group I thaumarchaeote SCGC AAA799-B03 TaxID=1502289 RepID=A0A087S6K7_9ARCH|nr:hypothetical protein AAA799B03_01093 [Marine Group I thaumarchaeote SCGC AAA799-B03]
MPEYLQSNYFASQKPVGKPSVITWKGVRLVRSHSITAVAKEIINMSENQEMVSINAIGKQSSGKTQLFFTLAHLVHKYAKVPYQISFFGKEELLNLEETVKKLKPQNQLIIFDDIAFLKASATNKQIDQIQQILSVIRHLPGGESVKIILMKSFQYSKAIPPFLRQNDFTFLSSVDNSDDIESMIGKKHHKKIQQLKELRSQGSIHGKFEYKMGNQGKVTYQWQKPFLPFLYISGIGSRIVVSPLREWIDPICNQCAGTTEVSETADVENAIEDFKNKFGDGSVIRQAVKIKLIQQGINCYPPRVVQAVRYIDQLQQKKIISIESLANALELTETRTSLYPRKQPA